MGRAFSEFDGHRPQPADHKRYAAKDWIETVRSLTHDQRYEQLQLIRQSHRTVSEDRTGLTVELDGRDCIDIPAFYLALGSAINGPRGYYGACLDSLADCVCGGFGMTAPFTVVFRHSEKLRCNFDHKAERQFIRAQRADLLDGTGEATLIQRGSGRFERPHDSSYLDEILDVFDRHGVSVVLS